MISQKDLEGKVCPIDGTLFKIENMGEGRYVLCRICNKIYADADKERINDREKILKYGKDKGLI